VKSHKVSLEDLDIAYSRSVEDLAEDREEAIADELESYEENLPKIAQVFTDAWQSMKDAMIQTAIDTVIDDFITKLWDMATEAELATQATNTSLAGVGTGTGIGAAALQLATVAGAAVVASDIISGKSTGVASLNKWLTDLIYGEGTYAAGRAGTVRVSSYAGGGVVPGPRGIPQAAIVHGGETIIRPGQEMDYERIGAADAAGTYDGMVDALKTRRTVGAAPSGDAFARALYPYLIAETERRGGAGVV